MELKNTLSKGLKMRGSKDTATLNSKIVYDIEFKNNSPQDIYNVKIPIKIPKNTKYKVENLYINGKICGVNKHKEFKIPIFSSKSTLKVTYSVIVDEIPLSGQVDNDIVISYKSKSDEGKVEKVYSNIVVTKIKGVKLYLEKILDKNDYKVKDSINEEIVIRNEGNIKAINVMLKEFLPEGIFIETVYVNNNKIEFIKNSEYILIGDIEPLASVKLKLEGKVISVDSSKNKIITKVKYDYFDDYEGKYILASIESKEIEIEYKIQDIEYIISDEESNNLDIKEVKETENLDINNENINCEIISDKERYIVGDIGVFNLYIDNLRDIQFEKVSIKINIPKEIQVINNDLYIDNISYKYNDEEDGIVIDSIDGNGGIVIKYHGLIKSMVNNSELSTNYVVKGYYNYNSFLEGKSEQYVSPILINRVDEISLKCFFVADKEVLLLGKDVKYTTTIINNGTLPVKIRYDLEHGSELQENEVSKSYEKSGKKINEIETEIGINIKPNDGVVIDKSYTYKRFNGNKLIWAKGIINIEYKSEEDEIYRNTKLETDILEIEGSNNTFEEVVVEDEIDISEVNPPIKEVSNIYFNTIITSKNIMPIKRESNYEGKDEVGYNLVYIAKISYNIEYLSTKAGDSMYYYMLKEKVFSSSINLPDSYINGGKISIMPEVLDLNYKIVGREKLFITINLLVDTNI